MKVEIKLIADKMNEEMMAIMSTHQYGRFHVLAFDIKEDLYHFDGIHMRNAALKS
jgi:hypothetical protein